MAWHNCFQKYPPLNFLHYVKPQSSPGKEPAPVKECSYQFIPPVLKSVTIPSISSYNLLNNDTPNLKVEQSPLQIKSAPRTHKNDTSCEQKYGKAFIQLGNPKPWLRTPVACVFCRRRKVSKLSFYFDL
ncbi:hypothetical protein F5884DRAFT_754136 [Xylogone sp. PMI_703]|nr:hypothetical protein F5884DRAFT_754136 [Xylogone sp. PMI_703]